MSEQIRVLIVDDDALVRSALSMLLAPEDIAIVGEATDGSEVMWMHVPEHASSAECVFCDVIRTTRRSARRLRRALPPLPRARCKPPSLRAQRHDRHDQPPAILGQLLPLGLDAITSDSPHELRQALSRILQTPPLAA